MSREDEARNEHPDFPWLAAGDPGGVALYLGSRGWLRDGEEVTSADRAGDGNMNLTLRIRTTQRGFILKQARPWVEKYPDVAAPWDRCLFEQRFYERIAGEPELAARMPALLERDPEARVLLLEDIAPARDRTDLYGGARLEAATLDELAAFAARLHASTWGDPDPTLRNPGMRELNHAHVFEIPLAPDNGLDLDALERGLGAATREIAGDAPYRGALRETGERYRADGPCLLHGDYFPGSWLCGDAGLRIIDPEFCFYGPPEVDLGCAVAHLALARQPLASAERFLDGYLQATRARADGRAEAFDGPWLARFAAAETMRRLVGVAQLPIPESGRGGVAQDFRRELLARSRDALVGGQWTSLWC